MRVDDLVKRADELIAIGQKAMTVSRGSIQGDDYTDQALASEYRSACLSFLVRTFGQDSTYPTEFRTTVKNNFYSSLKNGQGVLKAARGELAGGWVATTRGLITAEVFADFLEMAEHLLEQGYKDAAAVMIGGTLEEHLRQLASSNGIPVEELKDQRVVPRKADSINADLAKVAYGKLDQKTVTAG